MRRLFLLPLLLALAACESKAPAASAPARGSSEAVRVAEATPAAEPVPQLPGALWLATEHALVRIEGGARHEVTLPDAGLFPSRFALPDGRLVAIASKGDGSADSEQLALVGKGGAVTRIGPTAPMVRDPAVDPRGRWIAFAANLEGHFELYRLDLASRQHTRLTTNREGNFAPAVLGDALVHASSRDGDSELYVLPPAGAPRRLTAFHKDDLAPVPAPDGKTLVFESDREGPVRLFVVAADGTNLRRVSTRGADGGDEAEAVWSPDGARLAYVVDRGRERTVHVRELATGTEVTLTPAGARDAEPSWSPDGAWLALARETGKSTEVVAVRISDNHTVRVAAGRLPRWLR